MEIDRIIWYITSDGVNIKGGREGIHLTLSREGRPSGEAYIEVASEEDVALAEKKHNQHMGRRYIEGLLIAKFNKSAPSS